jgi:hypothetical protein
MNGFDYIPVGAALGDFRPLLSADGWFGTMDFGASEGRFGIGTCLRVIDPPGGNTSYHALMHVWNGGFVLGTAVLIGGLCTLKLYDAQADRIALEIDFANLGIITFKAGGGTYRSRTGAYRSGAWFYLEVKHLPSLFEVRINGDVVVRVTVGLTDPLTFDTLTLNVGYSEGQSFFDDMYIIDPTEAGHQDYLGNITVRSQLVTGNGGHLDFTPHGQGTNYLNANNYKIPSTDYNFSPDVGDYDLYVANPNVAARDIFALQLKGLYYQDNGVQLFGANQFLVGIDGGTLQSGTQLGLNQTAPGSINDYWDVNPDTNAPFTTDQLNNLQIGPLLKASS